MRVFNGLADFERAIGTHLGYSDWHLVDQQQIDAFAELTGDRQWIHVEPDRAASGPFGATIAHGYFTLALLPKLIGQIYAVDGLTMGINYGADKVRFPAPLPVGTRVRAGADLTAWARQDSGVRAGVRVTIRGEGIDKPICVAETVLLLVP